MFKRRRFAAMDRIAEELGGIVESPIEYRLLPTTRLLISPRRLRYAALAGAVLVGLLVALLIPGRSSIAAGVVAWLALVVVGAVTGTRSFLLVWGEDRLVLVRWGRFTYRTIEVVIDTAFALCSAQGVFPPVDPLYPEFILETPVFTWRMGTSSANRGGVERLVAALARPPHPPPPDAQTAT